VFSCWLGVDWKMGVGFRSAKSGLSADYLCSLVLIVLIRAFRFWVPWSANYYCVIPCFECWWISVGMCVCCSGQWIVLWCFDRKLVGDIIVGCSDFGLLWIWIPCLAVYDILVVPYFGVDYSWLSFISSSCCLWCSRDVWWTDCGYFGSC
jgi:hypothetical protein